MVCCSTEEAPDLPVIHISTQKNMKSVIICINENWGTACDFWIIATNHEWCMRIKIPCPIHREERHCCIQHVEAEMHNCKLREMASKVYHAQQALKDYQTSTPGNSSMLWSCLSFLTVFNAQSLRLNSLCSQLAGACTKKFCFIWNT